MIPKIFHRIWLDEEVPAQYEMWWETLKALHPDWEFKSWERRADLDWLQNQALFDSFKDSERGSLALRADVARYEILNRFGGVYVDTDVEPLKPFDPLVNDDRPFIAWCSDQELDPAIIASPPGHPAIQALVDGLEAVHGWARRGGPMSPPGTTGPRYVTPLWRNREDVRRLPPVFFFPYHWSKMEQGKPPYPARSYAVHQWAGGWKKPSRFNGRPAAIATYKPPAISILIPFRDDDGTRTPTMKWVKRRWAKLFPEAEIVFGDDDGTPFSKTAAVNDAYTKATGNLFIVTDADSFVNDRTQIEPSLRVAYDTPRLVIPWSRCIRFDEEDSAALLKQAPHKAAVAIDPTAYRRALEPPNPITAGVLYVIRRDAFENVCGMDPRFRGWGHEDVCFRRACDALLGPTQYMGGEVISLGHPRPRKEGRGRVWEGDEGNRNIMLAGRYIRAERDRQGMRVLCNEHLLPGQAEVRDAALERTVRVSAETGTRIGTLTQAPSRIRETL